MTALRTAQIPLIVYSMNIHMLGERQGIQVATKPFDADDLVRVIARLLGTAEAPTQNAVRRETGTEVSR